MTAQVLCVMENHSPSSPYYPLQSTIFSSESEFEIDKECESSESTYDLTLNPTLEEPEKKQQLEKLNLEKQIVVKQEPLPMVKGKEKESEKGKEIQPKRNFRCTVPRNFPMLTLYTLKDVTVGILSCVTQTSLGLLDFLIRVCTNEGVHNVLMVTFTVTVEVFVIMVFAVATILATIIINVDDAYQNRRALKHPHENVKGVTGQGEVKSRSSRTRSGRTEKTGRRTPNSSILNFRVLEYSGNLSKVAGSTNPGSMDRPSEVLPKEAETSKYESDDSTIQEEENDTEARRSESPNCGDSDAETLKCDAIEPLPSQDPVVNKQSTIYRTKLLTIQDNETLLKKKCFPAPKIITSKNSDDPKENKQQNKDESESQPIIASSGIDGESKVRTDNKTDLNLLNSSPATNSDVLDNAAGSCMPLIECKRENGNTVGDNSPLSFVSTKRMFENNNN